MGKKKQRKKTEYIDQWNGNAIYSTDEIYFAEAMTLVRFWNPSPNPYQGFIIWIYFYTYILLFWFNFVGPERIYSLSSFVLIFMHGKRAWVCDVTKFSKHLHNELKSQTQGH